MMEMLFVTHLYSPHHHVQGGPAFLYFVKVLSPLPKTAWLFWNQSSALPPSPTDTPPKPPPPQHKKMSRPTAAPDLTPQFCFNQTALRDFLRLSRATIDDSITQHLNALLQPGTSTRFDPSSTSARPNFPAQGRRATGQQCDGFRSQILFPSWQMRSDVLTFCAAVATSPDPEDPDQLLRRVEDATARERVVDERLDPYSGRYFPREARTESLAGLLRNERAVERIIRSRTWGLVNERCGDGSGPDGWEKAFEAWREAQTER